MGETAQTVRRSSLQIMIRGRTLAKARTCLRVLGHEHDACVHTVSGDSWLMSEHLAVPTFMMRYRQGWASSEYLAGLLALPAPPQVRGERGCVPGGGRRLLRGGPGRPRPAAGRPRQHVPAAPHGPPAARRVPHRAAAPRLPRAAGQPGGASGTRRPGKEPAGACLCLCLVGSVLTGRRKSLGVFPPDPRLLCKESPPRAVGAPE